MTLYEHTIFLSIVNSAISMDEYHEIADDTMESLFERLEDVLDANHSFGYDVDYSVSLKACKVC
jgi:hypothetical protein